MKTAVAARPRQFKELIEVFRNDKLFGGDLLLETALRVETEVKSDDEWRQWILLVTEVREQYLFERRMLENGLAMSEDRPRIFFRVLPQESHWERLKISPKGIEVKRTSFNRREGKQKQKNALAVLLPVQNGFRRTYRSLACLAYDLEPLKDTDIEFHVCVNFSDEDSLSEVIRFAQTIARAKAIPVVVYWLDEPNRDESSATAIKGRKRWDKSLVLNIMLREVCRQNLHVSRDRFFLYFADDDIYIPPESGIIRESVRQLTKTQHLALVSATVTSDEDWGFSALSAVRKNPVYVRATKGEQNPFLFNLYGGCMTTTIERLQSILGPNCQLPILKDGKPAFSEDCYLTLKANADAIIATMNHDPVSPLRWHARADRRMLVGHQEATDVVSFAARLARDINWGTVASQTVSKGFKKKPADFKAAFEQLRQASFDPIGKRVARNSRHRLAQQWNNQIRQYISTHPDLFSESTDNRSIRWLNHITRHQLCLELVTNKDARDTVLRAASDLALGSIVIRLIEELATNPYAVFPRLCHSLVKAGGTGNSSAIRWEAAPHLFHLRHIAQDSALNVARFMLGARVDKPTIESRCGLSIEQLPKDYKEFWARILKKVGSALGEQIQKYRLRNLYSSQSSYAGYLKGPATERKAHAYFVRFYPVTGKNRFSQNSPRRTVYLNLLGESLIGAAISGELYKELPVTLVKTVYPSLKDATLNYAGPERIGAFDRFMQSILVQESLEGEAKQFVRSQLSQRQSNTLLSSLGHFLGTLHGRSLGLRFALDIPGAKAGPLGALALDIRTPLQQLAVEHLDQIGLFAPRRYAKWLKEDAFRNELDRLVQPNNGSASSMLKEVKRIIGREGVSLEDIWSDVQRESTDVHRDRGALGHLGLQSGTILLGCKTKTKGRVPYLITKLQRIYAYNHAGIAFVDPGVEAGLTFGGLITTLISTNLTSGMAREGSFPVQSRALAELQEKFLEEYFGAFTSCPTTTWKNDTEKRSFLERLRPRICRVAALSLLNSFHERLEYSLFPPLRMTLSHFCVDLLHEGETSKIRDRRYIQVSD